MTKYTVSTLSDYKKVHEIDQSFLSYLSEEDRIKLCDCRDKKNELSDEDILDFSLKLQSFLVFQFGIEAEYETLQQALKGFDHLATFHETFVKPALRQLKVSSCDMVLAQKVHDQVLKLPQSDERTVVAHLLLGGYTDIEIRSWCQYIWQEKLDPYCTSTVFLVPKRVDFDALVNVETIQPRSDYGFVGPTLSQSTIMHHINYCIYCHQKENDSCSIGLVDRKKGGYKFNPLGRELKGCPLNQKISQMHQLRSSHHVIAALAVVMIDNPLCLVTGDRICNDCMVSCIYQKFSPVDTPCVESDTLRQVLALPYGAEIYLLLAKWNPLKHRDVMCGDNNGSIAVVGMGPAGFAMSYYALHAGYRVVGLDGLPIYIDQNPHEIVKHFDIWAKDFNQGNPIGFGGVAEYGITVRWDKRLLYLVWVLLSRFPKFSMFGNVRLGGTVSVSALKELGFDHVTLATGAGLPQSLKIQTLDGMYFANEFLMRLHLSGMLNKPLQEGFSLPIRVIGGGLTAVDCATEALVHYIKWVGQVDFWGNTLSAKRLLEGFNDGQRVLINQWLLHGAAIRLARGDTQKILKVVNQSGGVSIIYRKRMQDSPAYRTNVIELQKALEQGVQYIEKTEVVSAIDNGLGQLVHLICKVEGKTVELPTATLFVATGSKPNVAYYYENRAELTLDGGYYKRSTKFLADSDVLPNYISVIGDLHPLYQGSVVGALASAKEGFGEVRECIADKKIDAVNMADLIGQVCIQIIKASVIFEGVVELVLQTKQKLPIGTYIKICVYDCEGVRHHITSIVIDQCRDKVIAWTKKDQDHVSDLLAGRHMGAMGPSGNRLISKKSEEVIVIFSDIGGMIWATAISQAARQQHKKVYLFVMEEIASEYKSYFDQVHQLQKWSDAQVDEEKFEIHYCLKAKLFRACSSMITMKPSAQYAIVDGAMMCLLKGICGQCIQWQVDAEGMRVKTVYACSWTSQPIELIDVNHLEIRQNKNQLGKNLYQKWNEIKLLSKNRESV